MTPQTCLHARGAVELRLIGALSEVWPFTTNDDIWSAAYGLDAWKRHYPGLVDHTYRMQPVDAAKVVVDCILWETRATGNKKGGGK